MELKVELIAKLDNLLANLDKAQSKLEAFGERATKAGKTLSVSVTAAITALGVASLRSYSQLDSLERGLLTLEKTAPNVQKRLSELREVAKLPGLGFNEAVQGDIRLRSAGLSADLAKRSMIAFGNAVATVGGGKAQLDGVLLALTQIQSKGKVSAEEINQINERVPQIRVAMKDAFGTADTEALGKMNVDATSFINGIVAQLEKLPQATGGIGNGWENFTDNIVMGASTIGRAIDQSFAITDKMNALGDAIGRATEWFQGLSPAVQGTALTVAALVAATGPLLLTIGFLSSNVLPALRAGLLLTQAAIAGITAPIALAVAGIAALAYVIYSNWAEIKAFISSSGLLDTALETIAAAWESIKALFNAGIEVIKAAWDKIKIFVVPVVKLALAQVTAVAKTLLGILGGVFKTFTGILTGDWTKAWEGIQAIFGNIWNGILDLALNGVKSLSSILAKGLEVLGLDSWAAKVKAGASSIEGLANRIKVSLPAATKALKDFNKEAAPTGPATTTGANKTFGTGISKEALDAAKDLVKKYREEVLLIGKNAEQKELQSLKTKYDEERAIIKAAGLSTSDIDRVYADKRLEITKKYADQRRDLERGLANDLALLGKEGREKDLISVDQWYNDQKAKIEALGGDLETLNALYAGKKKEVNATYDGQENGKLFDAKIARFDKSQAEVATADLDSWLSTMKDRVVKGSADMGSVMAVYAEKFKATQLLVNLQALNDGVLATFAGFKENLTGALSGGLEALLTGGNVLQALGSGFLKAMAGFLGQFGDQLIKFALAAQAFEALKKAVFLGGPISAGAAIGLLAAGIALKGIAGAISKSMGGKVPELANGGIAYGDTLARVGEYSGASSNPEVIAPLNKLKGLLGGSQQSVQLAGEFRLDGADLVLAYERAKRNNGRSF